MAESNGGGKKTDEQVSFLAGLAFVFAVSLVIFAAKPTLWKHLIENSPVPAGVGAVVFVLLIATSAIVVGRYSKVLGVVVAAAMVPGVIANVATRMYEPDPPWVDTVRAIGLLALFAVAFGGIVYYGRKYREFEKYIFTEATSLAFFATIIAAGAYAVMQMVFDLPRLSFGWVPLIGLAAWGASAGLISRKLK